MITKYSNQKEEIKKQELEEAAEEIKKGTRHFAKRQLTWFKHQPTRRRM